MRHDCGACPVRVGWVVLCSPMPAFEQEAGSAKTSTANMACRVGPARDAQVCLCAEIIVMGKSAVLSLSMFLVVSLFFSACNQRNQLMQVVLN